MYEVSLESNQTDFFSIFRLATLIANQQTNVNHEYLGKHSVHIFPSKIHVQLTNNGLYLVFFIKMEYKAKFCIKDQENMIKTFNIYNLYMF